MRQKHPDLVLDESSVKAFCPIAPSFSVAGKEAREHLNCALQTGAANGPAAAGLPNANLDVDALLHRQLTECLAPATGDTAGGHDHCIERASIRPLTCP